MVAVDASTPDNGCLEVSPGQWNADSLKLSPKGVLLAEDEDNLPWISVPCQPGDILFFSGYLPHRSGANHTSDSRRAIFLTYNPLSQGEHHEAYYEAKLVGARGFDSKHTLSFQSDFQGTVVD